MSPPFLSIIMRTRGDRERAFGDALASLAAQTDPDFELLVVLHSPDLARVDRIRAAVGTASLLERTKILRVEGGGRSVPLNVGLSNAEGRRVAVLDDDDVALPNWVEAFHRSDAGAERSLLRGAVLVEHVGSPGGPIQAWGRGYQDAYPLQFDVLCHLVRNETPFSGWAFPRTVVEEYGLRFDEELSVCEDWDFALRMLRRCDSVVNLGEYTSVYRHWPGGESSTTVHSGSEWAEAEAAVRAKLDASSLMLPPGSASRIKALLSADAELQELRTTRAWRLAKQIERAWRVIRGAR